MKKANIIVPALLSIAACGGIIAGSTYALFTSEAKTNIAVTSGKVDVSATISDLATYSGKTNSLTGDVTVDEANIVLTDTQGVFTNGGTAKIQDNALVLDKMTPGDKATFKITIKNKSNVAAKYRTKILKVEDTCLFSGLKFDIDGRSVQSNSDWVALEAVDGETEISSFDCTVELPSSAGSEFEGKSCKIAYIVEALQGNASTTDDLVADIKAKYGTDGLKMPSGVEIVSLGNEDNKFDLILNDKEAFVYFTQVFDPEEAFEARKTAWDNGEITKYDAEKNNSSLNMWYASYLPGITVKMGCDVDLDNILVTPFGFPGNGLTFDGEGYTIKNARIEGASGDIGFFENSATISNVTFDNITVNATGANAAGVVAGFTNKTVDNVTVKNSSVIGAKYTGTIVGYDYGDVTNCKIENTFVSGQYKVGGAVGYNCCEDQNTTRKVTGNALNNVTIIGENIWPEKESIGFILGKVVGNWVVRTGVCKENTFSGTTKATDFIGEIEASYVISLEQ